MHTDKSDETTARYILFSLLLVILEEISPFTFDTFENQLGPLQTPWDGHLLHTHTQENRVMCSACYSTKYDMRPCVSVFVEGRLTQVKEEG